MSRAVAAVDVLWAGAWSPPELDEIEARGALSILRCDSALRAVSELPRGGVRVALVAGDEIDGRERDAMQALHAAGAETVAVLYRPALAHRAPHATREGADATLQLPSYPGGVEQLITALLRRGSPSLLQPTSTSAERESAAAPGGSSAESDTVTAAQIVGHTVVPSTPDSLEALDSDDLHDLPDETDATDAADGPGSGRPAVPAALEIRRAAAPDPVGPPDRRALETLVGDSALVHRMVSDLDRLLDRVLDSFRVRSTATRSSLMLLDKARGELLMQRAIGLPDRDAWTPIPLGEGIAGRVARNGIPLLASDLAEIGEEFESWDSASPARDAYDTRSCLVLPLCGGEGVAGVVCLADKENGEPFTDADLRSLLFLSDQSGQALENAVKLRQMRDLAVIDELTGLYNRRYFQKALARETQRARRYDRPLTVAIMDLDHFKKFNDTCGHPAGDRALAAVGEILRTSLREVDIVARHGGEEFAVILPETSPAETNGTKAPFPFLERLRQRIEDASFEGQEKLPSGNLTVSIGVACFPSDADTAEDLFQKADDALYASKGHGRNVVTYRGRPVTG